MLSVRDVTTAYQGLVAISQVSIEVAKGEVVCVAGANGAGKSTLLKTIAGAERPRSGSVAFDGCRIGGMAQHAITKRGIAYVPENRRLFPRLSVRDTGIGIEPEMLGRVFETFSQADHSLDRSRGGLGLGLSLVKGLVEQHGGTVEARSDGPGKGSEFIVRLPLRREGEGKSK